MDRLAGASRIRLQRVKATIDSCNLSILLKFRERRQVLPLTAQGQSEDDVRTIVKVYCDNLRTISNVLQLT